MPQIIRRTGPYPAYLLSCAAMVLSAVLMATGQLWTYSAGLFCHVFAVAAAEVVLSLYVLGRVPRQQMTSFEPWRVFSLVLALTVGPFLGVYFKERVMHELPYILCAVFMLASIGWFRALDLHNSKLPVSKTSGGNPFRFLQRFLQQPRLRLAYGLVLARSCWWTMFIIYAPIYAEQSGLGELTGAAIVSIGTAWTFSVPLWGWVARRYGVRRLMMLGFGISSMLTLIVYLVIGSPSVASVLLIVSAFGATMLDGVGNVLFFRAVRGQRALGNDGSVCYLSRHRAIADARTVCGAAKLLRLARCICHGCVVDAGRGRFQRLYSKTLCASKNCRRC